MYRKIEHRSRIFGIGSMQRAFEYQDALVEARMAGEIEREIEDCGSPGTEDGREDAPTLEVPMDDGEGEGEDGVSVGSKDGAGPCAQSVSRVAAPPARPPKVPAVAWVGAWASFKPAGQMGDDDDDDDEGDDEEESVGGIAEYGICEACHQSGTGWTIHTVLRSNGTHDMHGLKQHYSAIHPGQEAEMHGQRLPMTAAQLAAWVDKHEREGKLQGGQALYHLRQKVKNALIDDPKLKANDEDEEESVGGIAEYGICEACHQSGTGWTIHNILHSNGTHDMLGLKQHYSAAHPGQEAEIHGQRLPMTITQLAAWLDKHEREGKLQGGEALYHLKLKVKKALIADSKLQAKQAASGPITRRASAAVSVSSSSSSSSSSSVVHAAEALLHLKPVAAGVKQGPKPQFVKTQPRAKAKAKAAPSGAQTAPQQQQQQQSELQLDNEMLQLRQQLEEQRRTMQAGIDTLQQRLRMQERLLQKGSEKVDEHESRVSTLEHELQRERSRGQMMEKQLQKQRGSSKKRPAASSSAVPAPSVSRSDSPALQHPSVSVFASSSSSSSSSSSRPSDPATNASRKRYKHEEVSDAAAISSWTCSSCTFSNINEHSIRCQVCETPRTKYQRQSARLDHKGADSTENGNGNISLSLSHSLMDASDLVI